MTIAPVSAAPRFITPRTSPYTYGRRIGEMASAAGYPLMPWQQLAVDLVGECDRDGRLLHPVVVVTVQRQAGKTTALFPVMAHRAIRRPRQRIWYSAQTGQHAREQLLEMADSTAGSAIGPLLDVKRASANTSIEIPGLGSRIKAHPPTAGSMHSRQSDLSVVDEAWTFDIETAAALMAAIVPTQATRPDPQTLIVSTAGTADSVWFHGLIADGYAGRIAIIDYGVPEGTSEDDLDTIVAHHPAIGHTQTREALAVVGGIMPNPSG